MDETAGRAFFLSCGSFGYVNVKKGGLQDGKKEKEPGKTVNETEDFKPTPLNDNDPELETAYLNSYSVETKDIPKDAKLIGVIEALAFPVEIYQDADGNYISCDTRKVRK